MGCLGFSTHATVLLNELNLPQAYASNSWGEWKVKKKEELHEAINKTEQVDRVSNCMLEMHSSTTKNICRRAKGGRNRATGNIYNLQVHYPVFYPPISAKHKLHADYGVVIIVILYLWLLLLVRKISKYEVNLSLVV